MKKILLFLVAIALPFWLFADTDPLSSTWQGQRLALVTESGAEYLLFEDGVRLILPSLRRGDYTNLQEAGNSWIALGTQRAGDSSRKLVAYRGDQSEIHDFPVPGHQKERLRHGGQLLVENGILRGMVFFEGPSKDRLDLWYTLWNGERWKRPRKVAPAVKGSQLSLSAAVLSDGSWLVVWSRFDGTDDEVFWTRREGDQFTPIRRASPDNQVPDINPTLVASENGALLAWSRWDEEGYRLQVAHFSGGVFGEAQAAGPLGSLYPSFDRSGDDHYLLYLEASPRSWAVAALDSKGKVTARARTLSTSRDRPLLSFGESSRVSLRWTAEKATVNLELEAEP